MQTYHGCRSRLPDGGLKLQCQAQLMAKVKYLLAPVVFVQSDSGANTCTLIFPFVLLSFSSRLGG